MTRSTVTHAGGRDGVFHEGELAAQRATGERALAERNARMMAGAVPPAPAAFLAQQRMLVLASADEAGAMWASLVFGEAGFASAAGGETVTIDRTRCQIAPADALLGNLRVGGMLGLLAIELGSRRRYRVNGWVAALDDERIDLAVHEAFVNCPKYIQRRHLREIDTPSPERTLVASGTFLDSEREARIRRADTMFVASRHPGRGADASHRGGAQGFLQVRDERTIRIPEYAGNGLYNTLGNLLVSDRAGLAIVDFDDGRVIQLTGSATVVLNAPPEAHERATGDPGKSPKGGAPGLAGAATGRYWDFQVARWTELALPRTFRWELIDRSPFNPRPAM
jgi:predicted pyridoxine 5'-phosphate oxidase superfamily flavin-nucleotide-binding protein